MTTIQITADMTLRDIAMAAYRTCPRDIDFDQDPDGIIHFTDDLRPGDRFDFGPETVFGGDEPTGVAWTERVGAEPATEDSADYPGDAVASDGCDLDRLDELAAALVAWCDRVPTDIDYIVEWDGEDVDLRQLSDEMLADMRVAAGTAGDHQLVRGINWVLRTR